MDARYALSLLRPSFSAPFALGNLSIPGGNTTPSVGHYPASGGWPEPIRILHGKITDAGVIAEPFEVFLVHGRLGLRHEHVYIRACRFRSGVADIVEGKRSGCCLTCRAKIRAMSEGRRVRSRNGTALADWWIQPTDHRHTYCQSARTSSKAREGDMYVLAADAGAQTRLSPLTTSIFDVSPNKSPQLTRQSRGSHAQVPANRRDRVVAPLAQPDSCR